MGMKSKKHIQKVKLKGEKVFNRINYLVMLLIALITAYPLYYVVIASISDPRAIATGKVLLWPVEVGLGGYIKMFEDERIWLGYWNIVVFAVTGVAFSLFVTIPLAYALSRKDFYMRKILNILFLVPMFFSGGLVPTFVLINKLHMVNTFWVMIIPFSLNIFNLIICRSFFEGSIPDELREASQIDGCSNIKFFLKMVLPLSKPIIAVVGLYYFVAKWNDWFTPMIYLSKRSDLVPLPLVLREILILQQALSGGAASVGSASVQQMYIDLVKYCVIIVSTLPLLIIYPFVQKYFTKGIMVGAVKG